MPAQSIEVISAENQHLQQQLDMDYAHYYHCYAQYLIDNGAFCPPLVLEEQKQTVLQQIIQLQTTNQVCQAYYQSSAVELARNHLAQTPHSGRSYLKAGLLFALTFAFPQVLGPEHMFDLSGTILFMVLGGAGAILICYILAHVKDIFQGVLSWGVVSLVTLLNLVLALQVHTNAVYHLSGPVGMISLALITLVAVLLDPISGYENTFDRIVLILTITNTCLGMLAIIINTVTVKEGANPLANNWVAMIFAMLVLFSTILMWRLIKYFR